MIKAIFFDIDGTLVSLKTGRCPETTKQALRELKRRGYFLFVATGRSMIEIRQQDMLAGMEFDAVLCDNGQDAYAPDGTLLYGRPIDPDDVKALFQYARETGTPCWAVGENTARISCSTPRVEKVMRDIHTALPEFGDLRPMEDGPVYKIVFFLGDGEMRQVMTRAPHSLFSKWHESGRDVISPDGGKANAMLAMGEKFGFTPEEMMAFGDSDNDISMLRLAKTGIVMGNGTDSAKKEADYVTGDCDGDGIPSALRRFGLLDDGSRRPEQKTGGDLSQI